MHKKNEFYIIFFSLRTEVFSVENVVKDNSTVIQICEKNVCIFVSFENHKINNKTFLTWTTMSFQMIRRSNVFYFYLALYQNCFLTRFVHRVKQSTAHLFYMKLFLKLEHYGWNVWFEINWKINTKYQISKLNEATLPSNKANFSALSKQSINNIRINQLRNAWQLPGKIFTYILWQFNYK